MFEKLYNQKLKDLPVNEIVDQVIDNIDTALPIVSSPTGSGKTLIIPAKLADHLPEGERVVVLVPRKFLAINAAETVAELSGTTLGEEVGYAVGTQGGDEPLFSKNSKIVFMTYGYAISSGAISYEKNIILDEVHEAGMDISIAKALLEHRKRSDDSLKVVEMSATINLDKQTEYWRDFNPKGIECAGRTYDCKIIEDGYKSAIEHTMDLLVEHQRKGIAVFQSGVADIKDFAEELEARLATKGINDVEVASIYGDMDKKERDKALKAPKQGNRKVLIGTNVIESGMNIPWLDSGVTSGTGKDLFVTSSGAVMLAEQNLPQWRLQQQKGRVCRFTDGMFVLASRTSWEDRPKETVAEISRLPLSELVMACASFGLKAEELNFDARIDSSQLKLAKEKLTRLGLIDEKDRLTNLGRFASQLPVTVENAVMLNYARNREHCLEEAVVLAGILEQGNIKQDFRSSHHLDKTSDVFDALKAFTAVDRELAKVKQDNSGNKNDEKTRDLIFRSHNVSKKRFYEAKEFIRDLAGRLNVRVNTKADKFDFDKLKQAMIAGHLEHLHSRGSNIFNGDSSNISNSSVVGERWDTPKLFLADDKVIKPRNGGRSFGIKENVTILETNDVAKFLKNNPHLISRYDSGGAFKILDSDYIRDSNLSENVGDLYRAKVNKALQVLESRGVEEFSKIFGQEQIPLYFWKEAIAENQKDDGYYTALNLPIPEKKFDLEKILGMEGNSSSQHIEFDENKLAELGVIKNGKAELSLNLDNQINLKLNNPDLEVEVTVLQGKGTLIFEKSKVKSLDIKTNEDSAVSYLIVNDLQAESLSLHDASIYKMNSCRTEINQIDVKNVKADFLEFDGSKVDDMKFDNSTIRKIDVYHMSFDKEIDFKQTEIKEFDFGSSTKLRGEQLYLYHDEDNHIVQSTIDPEEIKRIYSQISETIKSSDNPEEIDVRGLCAGSLLKDEQINNLMEVQRNKIKEIEIRRIKEEEQRQEQLRREEELRQEQLRQEEERRKEDAYQKQLLQHHKQLFGEIAEIEFDKLADFRKEIIERDGFEIRMADLVAMKRGAEEREAQKRADFYKRETLREIFYDAIADEITNVNGEIHRGAGDSKASRQRLYSAINDYAEEEGVEGDWYRFNITDHELGEDEDIFMANIEYMEKKYVVPDIEKNGDILDSDYCFYERQDIKPEKSKKQKQQEAVKAQSSEPSQDALKALAMAFGSKSGRK